MRSVRLPTLCLPVLLVACIGASDERDGGVDARVLECEAPLSTTLSPSTRPPNVGLPTASIAWTGNGCALYDDEGHIDAVLFIADTTGTWFNVGLLAQASAGWIITESSTGAGRTMYLTALPTDTDIHVELESGDARVSVDFRIVGDTLTLLAMSEL